MIVCCHVVGVFVLPRTAGWTPTLEFSGHRPHQSFRSFKPLVLEWLASSSLPTRQWVAPAHSRPSDKLIFISVASVFEPPAATQREPCQMFLFRAAIIFTSGWGCKTEEGSARSPAGDKEILCSNVVSPLLWRTNGLSIWKHPQKKKQAAFIPHIRVAKISWRTFWYLMKQGKTWIVIGWQNLYSHHSNYLFYLHIVSQRLADWFIMCLYADINLLTNTCLAMLYLCSKQ